MRNQRQPSELAMQWTSCAKCAALDDMGVNHGRSHAVMLLPGGLGRKKTHITGRKADLLREIRKLRNSITMMGGIKEKIAPLFDKNSFRRIFSS